MSKLKGHTRRERPPCRSAVPGPRFTAEFGEYEIVDFAPFWAKIHGTALQAVPYKDLLSF